MAVTRTRSIWLQVPVHATFAQYTDKYLTSSNAGLRTTLLGGGKVIIIEQDVSLQFWLLPR